MKLLSSITLALLSTTLAYAQTTMCFKENHNSMSTIESTKLDGGECKSKYTLNEMKAKGYQIDDIKISNNSNNSYSFVYILKNETSNANFNTVLNEKELENRIIKKMKIQKEKEKKEKEIKKKINLISNGKKIYINKCQTCHGTKGEKAAYNVGKPIKHLSEDELIYSINQYSLDSQYGNNFNLIMKTVADGITKKDLKKIKAYLDSINKK